MDAVLPVTRTVERRLTESLPSIFDKMLNLPVAADPTPAPIRSDDGEIIGTVGFTGKATGSIHLHATVSFGRVIVGRMLGFEPQDVDTGEMLNDAFGELCNMVVGNVKSHLCDEGFPCTLTVPSIIRGEELVFRGTTEAEQRLLPFRSGDHTLLVGLFIKKV